MAIEVPSFWDYLAGAGNQGIQSYTQAKNRVQDQQQQAAGLMTQLYGSGAVDSGALQGALGSVPGLPKGIKVNPGQAEKLRTPGTPENIKQQASVGADQAAIRKQAITDKWTRGEPISEEEAALAGLPTKQDMAQLKNTKADPILEKAGEQYVDAAVLKLGGRINPAQAGQIAQQAYQRFVQEYQAAGMGTLDDKQLQNAQRYFASRAMNLLIKQREDDSRMVAAQNRSSVAPQDRMFSQLTTLQESARKTLDDFLGANPGVETIASKYKGKEDAAPAAFKGKIARYNMLLQRIGDLQTAQAQLAMGVVPKDFAKLLMTSAGLGVAVDQGKVNTLVSRIRGNKALRSQLETGLASGTISQAEYKAIKFALGEK